ncbi:MAG: hypothetical protein RL160_1388 [Bacteroidota bacterium]
MNASSVEADDVSGTARRFTYLLSELLVQRRGSWSLDANLVKHVTYKT